MSILHRYKCNRMEDLYTEHSPILRAMVSIDCIRVLILGDPGTGKSTICRVLLNEYYETIDNSRDNVLHISNINDQGIQFYRNDVRTFCQTNCFGKKKTIVIDDIDCMADSGQQVFINYLDLFPKINFIVTATSKIAAGIHSCLVCLRLSPFQNEYLQRELERIAQIENIVVEENAGAIVVSRSSGSMRILLNNLEKISLLGRGLTREVVDACCSNIDARILGAFCDAIETKREYDAIDIVLSIQRDGFSVMDILDAYFTYVKQCKLTDERKYAIIRVLTKYIAIFNQVHEHAIELIFCVHDLCNSCNTWT